MLTFLWILTFFYSCIYALLTLVIPAIQMDVVEVKRSEDGNKVPSSAFSVHIPNILYGLETIFGISICPKFLFTAYAINPEFYFNGWQILLNEIVPIDIGHQDIFLTACRRIRPVGIISYYLIFLISNVWWKNTFDQGKMLKFPMNIRRNENDERFCRPTL